MTAIVILVLLLSVAVNGITLPVSPVRPAPSSAVQTDAPGAESPEQIISLVRQYDYSERMTEESAERMIAACTLLYDHAEQWAETYHLSAKAASCEVIRPCQVDTGNIQSNSTAPCPSGQGAFAIRRLNGA